MLAEAVKASPAVNTHAPGLSVTGLSECAYAIFLNYHKLHPRDKSNHLVLEDGNFQEAAMLVQLARAGYEMWYIGKNQLELYFSAAKIPGHPDGLIWEPSNGICMLELKAMNETRFDYLRKAGLEPGIKTQVQCYMHCLQELGLDIELTYVYAKDKESCEPYDHLEEYDAFYVAQIEGAVEEVVLGGWEPKPVKRHLCTQCRHSKYCWSGNLFDMTDATDEEVETAAVKQWFDGRQRRNVGKLQYEQARDYLVYQLLESGKDSMLFETSEEEEFLKVEAKKQFSSTYKFNELLFSQEYGAQNLYKVMDRVTTESVVTREVVR